MHTSHSPIMDLHGYATVNDVPINQQDIGNLLIGDIFTTSATSKLLADYWLMIIDVIFTI